MKGDRLPVQDNIARYCGRRQITEDGNIAPTAFYLRRDKNEQFISVRWLECLGQPDRKHEIAEVRRILGLNLNLGATARIAVLNVGDVCIHVERQAGLIIRVLHEPDIEDPSHSGIHDTIQDEDLIAKLIAEKVLEIHTAIESS